MMFNFEKIVFLLFILLLGFSIGAWIGYPRGQDSRQGQINSLQLQLKDCNSTTNNVEIGKIKGKGTADIIQKLATTKENNPFVFGCKQDTNGIVKWFCSLPRKERRKIEKDL